MITLIYLLLLKENCLSFKRNYTKFIDEESDYSNLATINFRNINTSVPIPKDIIIYAFMSAICDKKLLTYNEKKKYEYFSEFDFQKMKSKNILFTVDSNEIANFVFLEDIYIKKISSIYESIKKEKKTFKKKYFDPLGYQYYHYGYIFTDSKKINYFIKLGNKNYRFSINSKSFFKLTDDYFKKFSSHRRSLRNDENMKKIYQNLYFIRTGIILRKNKFN